MTVNFRGFPSAGRVFRLVTLVNLSSEPPVLQRGAAKKPRPAMGEARRAMPPRIEAKKHLRKLLRSGGWAGLQVGCVEQQELGAGLSCMVVDVL